MLRVPYQELLEALRRALLRLGIESERASLCARLFTETTCDGVYSHGLNRFSRFVRMIHNGTVDVHARPELVASYGALERWDGKLGIGNLNGHQAMDRAIEVARRHGIGCVALANTIFSATGLPDKVIRNVKWINVTAQGEAAGLIEYARAWSMNNVKLQTRDGLAVRTSNNSNVDTPSVGKQ